MLDFISNVASTVLSSPLFTLFTKGNALRNVGTESAFILSNSDLSVSQKIVPATGVIIAGGAAIIAVTSLIWGLPYWIPPLMFITSLGGFAYDLGFYVEEREERQSLLNQFISKSDLQSKINKTISNDKQKEIIFEYSCGQSEIIASLYQIRFQIINDKKYSLKTKREFIHLVNQLIEQVHQDLPFSTQDFKLKLKQLKEIRATSDTLLKRIASYNNARREFKKINLNPDFNDLIESFRTMQGKIFTQDLPLEDKQKLVKLLEDKTINDNELELLLAKIGNHFVNHSSHWQVQARDYELNDSLDKVIKRTNQLKAIVQFYQLPRKIAHQLHQLIDKIKQDKNFTQKNKDKLIANIMSIHHQLSSPVYTASQQADWKKLKQSLGRYKKETADIEKTLSQLNPYFKKFNDVMKRHEKTDIPNRIIRHRTTTLVQFSFGLDNEFSLPKLSTDDQNNLIAEIESTAVGKEIVEVEHEVEQEIDGWLETLKGSLFNDEVEPEELKAAKDKLRAKFRHHYGHSIEMIQKAQRLHYLQRAAPRHCLNVGFDVSASALPLLLSSSLTPLALVNTITYIYKAIPAFSAANGIELAIRKSQAERTLNQGIVELIEGIIPDRKMPTV